MERASHALALEGLVKSFRNYIFCHQETASNVNLHLSPPTTITAVAVVVVILRPHLNLQFRLETTTNYGKVQFSVALIYIAHLIHRGICDCGQQTVRPNMAIDSCSCTLWDLINSQVKQQLLGLFLLIVRAARVGSRGRKTLFG